MHRLVVAYLVVVGLFGCGLSDALVLRGHAAEAPVYQRWAVLADGPIQQAGLADLVITRLAKQEEFQHVERDQIETVTRELKLSALADSQSAERRLRLGQMLKADALMLLTYERGETGERVKLVISESLYGARLRVELRPLKTGIQDELAGQMVAAAVETQRRFAAGIRRIIGVSPFVSKNLTHDYDYLQASYAYLLENALAAFPNVAVIETEEAVAIRRELALSGESAVSRTVPVLLDADFLVEPAGDREEPRITFTVRTRTALQGEKPTESIEQMPLSQAPRFITEALPRRYLRLGPTGSGGGFSGEEQIRWLVDRAEAFSQLGDWEHATALREAALLLDPTLARQRLKLILEYRKIYCDRELDRQARAQYRSRENPPWMDDPDDLRPFYARAAAYLAALPHLEYLVRNRRIDRGLALELGIRMMSLQLTIGLPMEGLSDGLRQQVLRQLDAAERAEMVMLTEVLPLTLALPQTLPEDLADEKWHESNYHLMDSDNFSMHLAQTVIAGVVYRRDRDYYRTEDLADAKRAMELLAKLDLPISINCPSLSPQSRTSYRGRVPRQGEITDEQWITFLNELKNMPYAAAKYHAFLGLLEALRRGTAGPESSGSAVAAEALAWLERCEAGQLSKPQLRLFGGMGRLLRRECQRYLPAESGAPGGSRLAHREPQSLSQARVAEAKVETTASGNPRVIIDRLCLDQIDLKVRHLDGQTGPLDDELIGLTRCGDALDAAWSEQKVYLMQQPGLLTEVLADADEQFLAAAWDGRSVWVAGLRRGVAVLDPAGKLVGRIGPDQGLPAHDKKLLIHPVGPDRCIAVGQFGRLGRAWCALIERASAEPGYQVRVFHQATKVPVKDWHNTPDDTQLVFEPLRLHVCDTPPSGRRILYVFRRAGTDTTHTHPLTIDLATLEVGIAEERFDRTIDIPRSSGLPGSGILRTWGFHLPHGEKMDRARGDQGPALCRQSACPPWPLYYDGWLYRTNGLWLRMHAQTWQHQYLVDGLLPDGYWLRRGAVSAHYGLVGWTSGPRGKFYRVTVKQSERLNEQR